MRELTLGMSVSLDGFVSGPDGEAKWIFSGDQEAIAWKVKNMWNASLHIMQVHSEGAQGHRNACGCPGVIAVRGCGR
jgi:hypothetical protein